MVGDGTRWSRGEGMRAERMIGYARVCRVREGRRCDGR